jgi:hypothetical protein
LPRAVQDAFPLLARLTYDPAIKQAMKQVWSPSRCTLPVNTFAGAERVDLLFALLCVWSLELNR